MIVAELIKTLQDLNPEHNVILSKDAEGNDYKDLVMEEDGFSWSLDDFDPHSANSVVLWPV